MNWRLIRSVLVAAIILSGVGIGLGSVGYTILTGSYLGWIASYNPTISLAAFDSISAAIGIIARWRVVGRRARRMLNWLVGGFILAVVANIASHVIEGGAEILKPMVIAAELFGFTQLLRLCLVFRSNSKARTATADHQAPRSLPES